MLDRLVESGSVFPQPGVTGNVFDRATKSWIRDEHHVEEVTRFFRDPVGEDERSVENVLVEQVDVVSLRIRWIVVVREVTG